jgi:hypothetical protein
VAIYEHYSNLKSRAPRKNDDDDDSDDDEEEEEESEEESEEEPAAGGSAEPQPELSRAERKELKKKQAAAKQQEGDDEDEDLINPNHVSKKMNISDLNAPRELTRRERHVVSLPIFVFSDADSGSRRRSRMPRIATGRLVSLLKVQSSMLSLRPPASPCREDRSGKG